MTGEENASQENLFSETTDGVPHDVVDPFVRPLPKGRARRARASDPGAWWEHPVPGQLGGALQAMSRMGDRKSAIRWAGRVDSEQLATYRSELLWAIQCECRPAVLSGLLTALWLLAYPGRPDVVKSDKGKVA